MTVRVLPFPILLVVLLGIPKDASGQECEYGEVSHLFIDNHSIFDLDDPPTERFQWVYRVVNSLHIPTRSSFVRRELLLGVGDCYDPFLVADSERILRRFPFISSAEVYGLQQADGSWHVIADTRDEWSTRLEVTAGVENGLELRRLALSEQNFLGYGIAVKGFLNQRDANRRIGAEVSTPQLLATETDLRVAGGETRIGSFYSLDLTYPFVGEVGRWGWRAFGSFLEDYFDYATGTPAEPGHVLLPVEEKLLEFTVARRFGEPGNLTSLGIGLSQEDMTSPGFPEALRVVEGGDFNDLLPADADSRDAVMPQTFFASGTRVNLLFGQRSIRFIQRTGLDALRGVTDVELGSEVDLTLSRTVASGFGSEAPDDIGVRFRLYGGAASDETVAAVDVGIDARQVFFDPGATRTGWRDLLAGADVLVYHQPRAAPRHTILARVSAAGGWTLDRPFQLTLGGDTGVRGFEEEHFPGARRIVFNLEDRIYLGWPLPEVLDVGLTVFADAGHMWAGDVPFGGDSGWVGSLGGGLRLGFPAGSRGVARVDLAWPVDGSGVGSSPVFRIALADLIGLQRGRNTPQLQRSRLLEVGPDRFAPRR